MNFEVLAPYRQRYLKELFQLGIVVFRRAETKDHLRCERVAVSPYVISKVIWIIEKIYEHLFVLEILVRDVCDGSTHIEDVVYHAVHFAP